VNLCFVQVITLFQMMSKCNLVKNSFVTVKSVWGKLNGISYLKVKQFEYWNNI